MTSFVQWVILSTNKYLGISTWIWRFSWIIAAFTSDQHIQEGHCEWNGKRNKRLNMTNTVNRGGFVTDLTCRRGGFKLLARNWRLRTPLLWLVEMQPDHVAYIYIICFSILMSTAAFLIGGTNARTSERDRWILQQQMGHNQRWDTSRMMHFFFKCIKCLLFLMKVQLVK